MTPLPCPVCGHDHPRQAGSYHEGWCQICEECNPPKANSLRGWNKLLDAADPDGEGPVTLPRYLADGLVQAYEAMISFASGEEEIESIRSKDWAQAKRVDLVMRQLLARYDAEPGWTVGPRRRTGSFMQIWQLQAAVEEWVDHNFPDATVDDQVLVLMEEVGELCHALVKSRQGIREVGRDDAKDAVGDIMIALAAVASKLDIDLELVTQETWQEVSKRDWQANPETGVRM